jgi:hypothetical protein
MTCTFFPILLTFQANCTIIKTLAKGGKMEEVREKKSKSAAWYILVPILIVTVVFIIYTLIQYFQWTAESPKDIEWSEKDINIG